MAGLLASLVLLGLTCGASAQFGVMQDPGPGYFYFYASGQIVIAKPDAGRVFGVIRSSDATNNAFPNKCPGSPFRGDWVDVTYGPGKRTLMATAAYSEAPASRPHGFQDGILTADVKSGAVVAFTPLDKAPATATFVPSTGKIFLTTSGSGANTQSLRVLDAGVQLEQSVSLPAAGPLASYAKSQDLYPGQLLQDYNMGGQGYFTSSVAPGVYSLDFFHQSLHPEARSLLDPQFISFAAYGCQATGGAVYSRMLRQAFILCADAAPASLSNKLTAPTPTKGTIQMDAATGKVIGLLPYVGDKIFITPDESFLLILSSAAKTIYMLQFNVSSRSVVAWNPLPFPSGYTPVDIVFAPKDPYYLAYISYLDVDRIGVLDFGRVLQCGQMCAPDNSGAYVQDQQQMGFQNPPNAFSDPFQGVPQPNFKPQASRAVAAGGGWVCQASVYEAAVYCFSPAIGTPIKFQNVSWVQHIRYVPESLTSYPDNLIRYNTFFDCNHPFEAAAPNSAPDSQGGDSFQDNAAPQGLRASFHVLATMYLAMALFAVLFRI